MVATGREIIAKVFGALVSSEHFQQWQRVGPACRAGPLRRGRTCKIQWSRSANGRSGEGEKDPLWNMAKRNREWGLSPLLPFSPSPLLICCYPTYYRLPVSRGF